MSECNLCHTEATVHFVDIDASGCMREVFLCKKHAEMYGFFQKNAYLLLSDLPTHTLGMILSSQSCLDCGCTQEWIAKEGKVGCPNCYTMFPEIRPQGIKQCAIYFGKFPKKYSAEAALKPRLNFLEQQLQSLIKSERFELAKEVRQKIKMIAREMEHASTHV